MLASGRGGEATSGQLTIAAQTARNQQARFLELRAMTSLTRLRKGYPTDFVNLADLVGSFTEGLTLPDILQARAVMDSSGIHWGEK